VGTGVGGGKSFYMSEAPDGVFGMGRAKDVA
jgi:hypothetical protein